MGEEGESLVLRSTNGSTVRLEASTGRLLGIDPAMAATG
jgi:phosphosulfolactate phosphohydrolase-like enzyme